MAGLELHAITKDFDKVKVLHGIDLTVQDGEFVVFVGPSGCGKSTLLRLICGLDDITSGQMLIDGFVVNDVPPSKRGIAMVFQSYALYPHMSVADNMGYALRLAGTPKPEIDARVRKAAEILRLDALLTRKPRQLSGGQRQRVAIGRAIVREPRMFLFDEPLSNLDAALRVDMRIEIARLKERLGTTMIYVTHDQVEAMTLADRIVVMRAGRVEQVGAPLELYERPANRFVAGFIGSPRMNFIDARMTAGSAQLADGSTIALPQAQPSHGQLVIGIRPEHLAPATRGTPGTLPGRVSFVEQLGSDTFAFVTTGARPEPILLRLPGGHRVSSGEPLALSLDPGRIHLFSADDDGKAITPPSSAHGQARA